MSVEGMKDLDKKLGKLLDTADIKKMVAKAAKTVRDAAVEGCPERRYGSGGGALRQSIFMSVDETEDGATGTVYTNSKYAPYVEFGTGPVGQENHCGTAPDANPVYSQTGWMMPGDAMDEDAAEQYGLGIARGKDGEVIGYYTNGQPAQPFMYPALKDNADSITKEMKTEFLVNIRKGIK